MGGVWERLIRTVRCALETLLVSAGTQLDYEAFRTLMTEVESIVNSRPLSVNDLNDPEAPEPLTPNQLLTPKQKLVLPPPGKFYTVVNGGEEYSTWPISFGIGGVKSFSRTCNLVASGHKEGGIWV